MRVLALVLAVLSCVSVGLNYGRDLEPGRTGDDVRIESASPDTGATQSPGGLAGISAEREQRAGSVLDGSESFAVHGDRSPARGNRQEVSIGARGDGIPSSNLRESVRGTASTGNGQRVGRSLEINTADSVPAMAGRTETNWRTCSTANKIRRDRSGRHNLRPGTSWANGIDGNYGRTDCRGGSCRLVSWRNESERSLVHSGGWQGLFDVSTAPRNPSLVLVTVRSSGSACPS